ncbi:lipocalin-like domain-containing protein [Williamsia sp. M5A3_1d]
MNTIRRLAIAVTAAGATLSLAGCGTSSESDDTERGLTGQWRMTSLESGGPNYTPTPYSGQITFTDSTVSVQAMNPDTSAPDTPYTVRGYEAFYGTLSVDTSASTFSVKVDSAAARDLIGDTLTRRYAVNDSTLVLTPVDASEGWRVTYARQSSGT